LARGAREGREPGWHENRVASLIRGIDLLAGNTSWTEADSFANSRPSGNLDGFAGGAHREREIDGEIRVGSSLLSFDRIAGTRSFGNDGVETGGTLVIA